MRLWFFESKPVESVLAALMVIGLSLGRGRGNLPLRIALGDACIGLLGERCRDSESTEGLLSPLVISCTTGESGVSTDSVGSGRTILGVTKDYVFFPLTPSCDCLISFALSVLTSLNDCDVVSEHTCEENRFSEYSVFTKSNLLLRISFGGCSPSNLSFSFSLNVYLSCKAAYL